MPLLFASDGFRPNEPISRAWSSSRANPVSPVVLALIVSKTPHLSDYSDALVGYVDTLSVRGDQRRFGHLYVKPGFSEPEGCRGPCGTSSYD